jgi:alkylation response protein AidB-like acyl-CoA dehydrogenase
MDFDLSEEHKMIQDSVREFSEKEIMPYGKEYDEKKEYPMKIYKKACKLGFIGASIPEEYNGAGMDCVAEAIISMEFCRADSGIGSAIDLATLGVPMIRYFGTEEQKEMMARVPKGDGPSAIAITEPDCGTDVSAMRTRAILDRGEWVISGTKQFITNGKVGIYTVVLAKTDVEADPPHKGISAFLVETDRDGYQANPIDKMGMNCHDTSEVVLKNVRVPKENLIGEENKGFYQLMRFFNESRIKIGALHLGIAIGAYERALQYAKERKTFGKPLIEHQAIQFKFADMYTAIEASRLLIYKAAYLVDRGEPDPALSSAAKLFASETAIRVTYEAVQIFGGYGFSKEYDVERYYRDARVGTIYEGTSEAQKIVIGRRLAGRIKV